MCAELFGHRFHVSFLIMSCRELDLIICPHTPDWNFLQDTFIGPSSVHLDEVMVLMCAFIYYLSCYLAFSFFLNMNNKQQKRQQTQ